MTAESPISAVSFGQLPSDLKELLGPRVERLGYLGEFFQVAAHQPEMLKGFIAFTEEGKTALPIDLLEVIALTAATIAGNSYERCQHEQLAIRSGMSEEWIRDVVECAPQRLSRKQVTVQRYVLSAMRFHGHGADSSLQQVVGELGEAAAVAVMLLCARYAAHAIVVNSCNIVSPVPSIFDDHDPQPFGAGEKGPQG